MYVLEELEHAQRRGAHIYCELAGYGATADAHHITAPDPDAKGASAVMLQAIDEAGLKPEDIDYINAHGTSTPINDAGETLAIKAVFGERARAVPISSTKSMTGHLLGAAGGVDSVATVLTLYHDQIPPTINHDDPDPDCDGLDYVPNTTRQMKVNAALNNSFGFGGHNASMVARKFRD